MHAQLDHKQVAIMRMKGRTPLHKTSATSFLAMGLELEESQYV